MKRSQLNKHGKIMLDVIETRIEHCKAQADRFKKMKDSDSELDWFHRELEAEAILKTIKEEIKLDD